MTQTLLVIWPEEKTPIRMSLFELFDRFILEGGKFIVEMQPDLPIKIRYIRNTIQE